MSSDQEENADHLDDPNADCSATEANQSLVKKDNGLNEHTKPRRRRRGKKRKHKKDSAATCEAVNPEECEIELHAESDHVSPTWNSDENLSCDVNTYTDVIIRPVNVPKAPENSTQFIMDDHNDCRFYMSFETPNPYLADPPHLDGEDGDIIEPDGEDAAYRDIDYQYESPQDFDNSAYYDREFELSYKNNRFDELMRLSRAELISAVQALESRLKELNDDLVKENPSPILETLQAQLLELQEKHSSLRDSNSELSAELLQYERDSSKDDITPESLPENLSLSIQDHDSPEESDREEVNDVKKLQNCEAVAEMSMSGNDVASEKCDNSCNNTQIVSNTSSDQLPTEQTKSKEFLCVTTFSSSGDEPTKMNNSNSHVVHCQPNIVKDDIRTLSINNSDLYNIAKQSKCSSAVSLEGGMSPSETSVN